MFTTGRKSDGCSKRDYYITRRWSLFRSRLFLGARNHNLSNYHKCVFTEENFSAFAQCCIGIRKQLSPPKISFPFHFQGEAWWLRFGLARVPPKILMCLDCESQFGCSSKWSWAQQCIKYTGPLLIWWCHINKTSSFRYKIYCFMCLAKLSEHWSCFSSALLTQARGCTCWLRCNLN